MSDKVICPKHPYKIRASKRNRKSLAIKIQRMKKKHHKTYRIYECEYCNGLHITSFAMKDYQKMISTYV